jgi:Flp pilus assembly protein CpaB
MLKTIKYSFRFPVKITGQKSIELVIERGAGPPVLNGDFVDIMELSDKEQDKAEELVL